MREMAYTFWEMLERQTQSQGEMYIDCRMGQVFEYRIYLRCSTHRCRTRRRMIAKTTLLPLEDQHQHVARVGHDMLGTKPLAAPLAQPRDLLRRSAL